MVNRKREYERSNLNRVYIYNTNDPGQLSISLDVFHDIGLARRICIAMDWDVVKHWNEAHPFHGLFWSNCTLYGITEIDHKACNSVATLLEVKAKNGMLSTFHHRAELYQPLYNSLFYPNHVHYKETKLLEIYSILKLDYRVDVTYVSTIDALINSIVDKILEVRSRR